MKKVFFYIILASFLLLCGCSGEQPQIAATTRPVYDFTAYLCQGTGLSVGRLVTENVSCLHDYTLQVRQMRTIEAADLIVISGAGLESFLDDALSAHNNIIDSSQGIELLCGEHDHHDEEHHHEQDPHIWLSVENARIMSQNICNALITQYPQHQALFTANMQSLNNEFDALESYGKEALSNLSCRELITFHDGFSYFCNYFDLQLLHALEEESGSEASAEELKELILLVQEHHLPAIFTEENGSVSAASVIAAQANIESYALNMGMADKGYFETMYHNIDTIKEALG